MKICAIICEYNPFHNGHLYHIQTAKKLSGADKIVCVMSGNFVQRGEGACLDKRIRAKHAIQAGADAVLELPTIFSTSNAELFAKGAIKLITAIPSVTTICFGAENADKDSFLNAAKILNDEPKEVSNELQQLLSNGISYAKARATAYSKYIQNDFLLKPNNSLGLAYTQALLKLNSTIEILPIERQGSGYTELGLQENFSSASAIRNELQHGNQEKILSNIPTFSCEDILSAKTPDLLALEKFAVLIKKKEEIAKVSDCTEGLENAFKQVAENGLLDFEKELTSLRYPSARIRRIALQNLLGIEKAFITQALDNDLYLRLLAVNKQNDEILSLLGQSSYPLLVRNSDTKKLTGIAREVFEKEEFCDRIYAIANNTSSLYHNPLV